MKDETNDGRTRMLLAYLQEHEKGMAERIAGYKKNAPPTLPALFAHFCAQHGEATFLVDGPIHHWHQP